MFFAAPVYVDSPRHLQCVTAGPVGCNGVSVNGVVYALCCRLIEDIAINCVVGAVVCYMFVFYKLA